MTVSMYAEPAEYAGGKAQIGVGETPSGKERVLLLVGPGGAELTKNEARELALGLVDAIAIFDEESQS